MHNCSAHAQDLAKDGVQHFAKARKFYSGVASELIAHGHAFDVFACALDQVSVWPGVDPFSFC